MFSIQIPGVDKLQDAFAQTSGYLTEQVKQTIADTAQAIVEAAKQNCSVKTGRLRDSISAAISPDGLSATITADAPYAAEVEYGPKGKPFLNPAFEQEKQSFSQLIIND